MAEIGRVQDIKWFLKSNFIQLRLGVETVGVILSLAALYSNLTCNVFLAIKITKMSPKE